MPIQQLFLGTSSAVAKTYVDDVFSSYLWKGNATARSINNGIDLSGEGGMTWIKSRSVVKGNILNDTVRGAGNRLGSNDYSASASGTAWLSAFNSNGFSIGTDGDVNENNETFSSWSFRKAPGFFDVVTFTGNGSNRTIAHSLGCVPGFYMVKKYNDTGDWKCYHKDVGPTKNLKLNTDDAAGTESTYWNDTAPTASVFSIGTSNEVNENGDSFVAYLFAHDEQSFGEGGDQAVIKCGTYAGTGGGYEVFANLGWEPQWILYKSFTNSGTTEGNWFIFDSTRGLHYKANQSPFLLPNTTDKEGYINTYDLSSAGLDVTPTGFTPSSGNQRVNKADGCQYIYVAIRRPDGYVGKPIEVGTSVLSIGTRSGSSSNELACVNTFIDFSFIKNYTSGGEYWATNARQIAQFSLKTNSNSSHLTGALPSGYAAQWGQMLGHIVAGSNGATNSPSGTMVDFGWKRHAGLDVSSYTGSGSADYVYHSCGQIPEMIWVKNRSSSTDWRVYHKGLGTNNDPFDYSLKLNEEDSQIDDATVWNDAAPEINRFTVGTHGDVNTSGDIYVSILFSSVAGVSKVGSFDGQNSTITVSLGFQPRFLIVKSITEDYDWYVFSTGGALSMANDQFLLLNESNAINTGGYGDFNSTSFELAGNVDETNKSGQKYIYYAHA